MNFAWQNIVHDRRRFLVTILGVSFAVFLMVFQGSLLFGFLKSASKLIDSSDFDIWMVPRGVRALEFGTPIEGRLKEMAAGVPGVAGTARVCMGFAVYQGPHGKKQLVAVVGADPNIGARFPASSPDQLGQDASPDALLYDRSDRKLIGVSTLPMEVEINGYRANIEKQVSGYAGFLGVPSLFTSYSNAARYLSINSDDAMYILVRVADGYSVSDVQRALQQRFPEVDVLTREEFAHSARTYWTIKTGAGGAILTAALLAFLIGLVVVSQTVYANTMENIEEYATLKALGASQFFVARAVLTQALICGMLGSILGLFAVIPVINQTKSLIHWIQTPWWLPAAMVLPSLIMCCLASTASVRSAVTVEPGRVFRA
jgi:putative ABC transport system permease protein